MKEQDKALVEGSVEEGACSWQDHEAALLAHIRPHIATALRQAEARGRAEAWNEGWCSGIKDGHTQSARTTPNPYVPLVVEVGE